MILLQLWGLKTEFKMCIRDRYYIDQDHHKGSKFESFDKLSQYQNFKENVLFYHFGVFDKDYFEIVREKEACEAAISECNKRHAVLDAMLQDRCV